MSTSSDHQKRQRALRKATGLCTKCGKVEAQLPSSRCSGCILKRKAYLNKNNDKFKEWRSNYCHKNNTEIARKKREYYKKNAAAIAQKAKVNREKDPAAYYTVIRASHKKHAKQISQQVRRRNQSRKLLVLTHYSAGREIKCLICDENRIGALTIDHVNGGGKKHRASLPAKHHGGSGFYKWLIDNNYPGGFRTLCMNCNIMEQQKRSQSLLSQAKKAVATRARNLITKQRFMNLIGGKCIICDRSELSILTVHHINNNGSEHRRQTGGGGVLFYKAIIKTNNFEGLECRCFSCNSIEAWGD